MILNSNTNRIHFSSEARSHLGNINQMAAANMIKGCPSMKHFSLGLSFCALIGFAGTGFGFGAESLPPKINEWFDESVELIKGIFKEQFADQEMINRQKTAANPKVQEFLLKRASILADMPDFSTTLKERFRGLRINSQPKGYQKESPKNTEGPSEEAAFHTIAGVAEIVCQGREKWQKSLEEHFLRIGGVSTAQSGAVF